MKVTWAKRPTPLKPTAAIASGRAAHRLARAILQRGDTATLHICVAANAIAVVGDEADLPWTDGVVYLGDDPIAPLLKVPTTLTSNVSLDLVERGVLAQFALAAPIAFWPGALMSLAPAAAASVSDLEEWLRGAF